jgi:hypothetical protein
MLREQWIKAKYARKLYTMDKPAERVKQHNTISFAQVQTSRISTRPATCVHTCRISRYFEQSTKLPSKTGYLTKRGQKRKSWKKRWFVMNGSILSYYKKANVFSLSLSLSPRLIADRCAGPDTSWNH